MTDPIPTPQANPILHKFRATLAEMYGEQLERVVLYGSRARGDATEDSDYDVAVFIKNLSDRMAESDRRNRRPVSNRHGDIRHSLRRRFLSRADHAHARNAARRVGPMTPEAARSLEKADQCLNTARAELAIDLGSEAGRNAYLAAFHAPRIKFERTGNVVKRHESVHREFNRLAKDERRIDKSFRLFFRKATT